MPELELEFTIVTRLIPEVGSSITLPLLVVEHDERTCMSLESQSEELHLHSSEQSGAY